MKNETSLVCSTIWYAASYCANTDIEKLFCLAFGTVWLVFHAIEFYKKEAKE